MKKPFSMMLLTCMFVMVFNVQPASTTNSDWCEIGVPYRAVDGLTVTLDSFTIVEKTGSYQYTITYTLKNENPNEAIDEGSFKMYYKHEAGGLPQYGFFGTLFPGDTKTRSYTFEELKSKPFDVLEYHHFNFFSHEPLEDSLKWKVVYLSDDEPPITVDDYDGLWHNTDFTITLTATDFLNDVAETYCRINDGPVKAVNTDGQLLIATEGANNTLEYWSIDNAGNEELPHKILTGIKLDKTVPTGSIAINNGDAYTTSTSVTLTLTATDAISGIAEMRFSNDNVTYTEWQTYAISKSWALQGGDGLKTVYVQFRDRAGLISIDSDTITLDSTPPTGSIAIAGGAAHTNSSSITLMLSASDATSGVAQMRFSDNNVTWSDWEAFATSKSWILTTGDGEKTVYVQFMDNTGLISQSYQDTIILDTTKPTANAGQDQTVNVGTSVNFDASASIDNIGIVSYEWDFGDGTTGTGVTTTHTYTEAETYTVTLTVTDAAGNNTTDTATITVTEEPFQTWMIAALVAVVVVIAMVVYFMVKRKSS